MEVTNKQLNRSMRNDPYENDEQPSSNSTKRNKKIRKSHHRKKGNISKSQYPNNNKLQIFIQENSDYFQVPIKQIITDFQQKKPQNLHIKNILNTETGLCFNQMKGNIEKQLQVFLQLTKSIHKYTAVEKIGLKSLKNDNKFQICYLKQSTQANQEGVVKSSIIRVLKLNEYILLKQLLQAIPQLERIFNFHASTKGYNQVEIPKYLLQLITLCKINATQQQEISSILENLAERQNFLFSQSNTAQLLQKQKNLQNQYIEAINISNLAKSFTESPIDFYNYHKTNEHYEDNNFQQTPFDEINFLSQFKKYSMNKKPKVNKKAIYVLRTSCSGCLTQFSQMSNPIQNCPQCNIRIHRYCQNVQNRCHRCRYGRTSKAEKMQTSYCYICNRENEKGLMIITVTKRSPHQFAHVYCLLLHNLWAIQNQQLVGYYSQPRLNNENCIYCGNNQGFFLNSLCCGKIMHGMCAFLNGISFNMRREGKDYKIQLNCCTNLQLKQRLSIQRKFKINFQKIIFRNDEYLFNYIEQKWRKN